MIHKKTPFTLCLLCSMSAALQAQDSLVVNLTSQGRTKLRLSEIRNLTFPKGMMTITQKNADHQSIYITAIRSVGFKQGLLTQLDEASADAGTLTLYPNIITDKQSTLYIALSVASKVQLTLVDASGKQVLHTHLSGSQGDNELTVNGLLPGVYLYRLSTETNSCFGKIFKY